MVEQGLLVSRTEILIRPVLKLEELATAKGQKP